MNSATILSKENLLLLQKENSLRAGAEKLMEPRELVSLKNAELKKEAAGPKNGSIDEESPVARARYEQLFPKRWQQGDEAASESRTVYSSTMDRTHDATPVDKTTREQSTYSYDSTRDWTMFFKEIDGRLFSSQSSAYVLPSDEIEFLRLDKQHAAHLISLGGLYSCPDLVEEILAPQPGVTKEILDLGCGTGIWALSMARQFPHARVKGVDVVPTPLNPDQIPPNVEFEIDDINLGLSHLANRFDIVHMRCVGGGLTDYGQGVTYAAQCVKPGGLILLVDYNLQLCAEDKVTTQKMATPNQKDGSWLQRFFYEVLCASVANGVDPFRGHNFLDHGLWNHPLLTDCGAANLFKPMGPWATSTDPEEAQRLTFAGILMRQNMKIGTRAFHTLLKKHGVDQDVLDELTAKVDEEMESLKVHSWLRLCLLWGRRKPLDSVSNTEGATPLVAKKSNWQPFRTIKIYQTQGESLAAKKLRENTVGELVEPLVSQKGKDVS
ncbi:S-adenosyl-L-methionine-dependent methyltransferase [Serendipita vermifera]|nr:S-adenosyl-L-methionine-dependent methyltransferase [Serendipita vermifera]